ncbi:MAG: hypothetical protein AAF916_10235 [Planctomycetota bacterium]
MKCFLTAFYLLVMAGGASAAFLESLVVSGASLETTQDVSIDPAFVGIFTTDLTETWIDMTPIGPSPQTGTLRLSQVNGTLEPWEKIKLVLDSGASFTGAPEFPLGSSAVVHVSGAMNEMASIELSVPAFDSVLVDLPLSLNGPTTLTITPIVVPEPALVSASALAVMALLRRSRSAFC